MTARTPARLFWHKKFLFPGSLPQNHRPLSPALRSFIITHEIGNAIHFPKTPFIKHATCGRKNRIYAYRLHAAGHKIDVRVRSIGHKMCYNDLRKRRRSLAWHEQRASRFRNFAPGSAPRTPAGQNYSGFGFRTASSARNAAVRNITQFADGTRSSAAPAGIRHPLPQEPLCTARIFR